MRIDLQATVTWDGARAVAADAWRWWTGELRALLPTQFGETADTWFQPWTIEAGEPTWYLRRGGAPAIALDMAAPASVTRGLVERVDPAALAAPLAVRIPASDVLVRHIRVPAAAAGRARAVVGLQLERLSPFPADAVAFDCNVAEPPLDGEVAVEVGIVRKATLAEYEAQLAELGMTATRFECGGLRFRPVKRRWTSGQKLAAALGAIALCAWGLVFALAPTLRDDEVAGLTASIADLRPTVQRTRDAQAELGRTRQALTLISAALAQPDQLTTLRALTLAVPADTYLTRLTLDAAALRFDAVGPSPERVLAGLRRSGAFRSPRIETVATQNGVSRFTVAAIVAPQLPELTP